MTALSAAFMDVLWWLGDQGLVPVSIRAAKESQLAYQ